MRTAAPQRWYFIHGRPAKRVACAGFGLLALCAVPVFAGVDADSQAVLLTQIRQLTFEGRRAGEGYFNADGSKLIFQSERLAANPFYQIYLLDMETGDVDQVSPGAGKTTCAWIHPRGEQVLYASTHEDPDTDSKMQAELDFRATGKQRRYSWDYDEHFDIYAQDLKTGRRTNLSNRPGYDAEGAYSPDGRKIVFASNRRAYSGEMSESERVVFEHDKSSMMDLYLMDADGRNPRRLTDSPGYDGGPFFSSDGKKITWRRFSMDGSQAEIFIMDLAGGAPRQVTRMGVMSWAPFFHPSGEYLIFASNREGFGNFELFIVDAEGEREPVRVTDRDGFDGLPVFSPDGNSLSWTSNLTAEKRSQIFLADWNDAEARRLLGLANTTSTGPVAGRPTETTSAISAADMRLHVDRLAAPEMEGRLTGTQGARLASAYVAAAFERLGLEPAGDDGTFFQAFPFTARASLGAGNRLVIGGIDGPEDVVLNRDWRPLVFSRDGEIEAAEVVFAGYGIVAPGAGEVPDYDSYGGLDVKSKWVMALRFQPEGVPVAWRRHLLHYSDLAYKASVAKRRGALGLIVVTGPNAASASRLVELQQDTAGGRTSIAGISLGDEPASRMLAAGGRDLQKLQDALDKGEPTEAFALPSVTVSAALEIIRERRLGRNVLARLRAQQPNSGSPVILGAHVDHLGRGAVSGSLAGMDERGEIHPGADDNASGVAGVLEGAQYLVGLKQRGRLEAKRDIWFAVWSGEELGTLGSSFFVEELAGKSDLHGKVSAYLNMDMIGHLREKAYLQGTGSSNRWPREIERRNVPIGLSIATKTDPYLPTDSTPFYMQGVPVLNAFTGAHENYSTPRDTPDKLNYAGAAEIVRLMAGITRSLALADDEPDYREVDRKASGVARKHLRVYLGTIPAYGQDESVKGVRLQGAIKGAPADKAGIRKGDILVSLAGVEIETIHDFMNAMAGLKAGEDTDMVVLRGGERRTFKVIPAYRE